MKNLYWSVLVITTLLMGIGSPSIEARDDAPAAKQTVVSPQNEATGVPTREELQKLTPAEREARAERMKERKALKGGQPTKLTPAEREQRRAEIQQRLNKRLEHLRAKQKTGELSAEDKQQLKRLEEVSKGFQKQRLDRPADPAAPASK